MAINDIVLICLILIFTLSGLISGFIKSISKFTSIALGILGSFYLGNYISNLFINNIESIGNYCANNKWCSILILIGSYIIVFLVIVILCKIIFKALDVIFESGVAGQILNKILGIVFGICVGFIFADIYSWALYFVANISEKSAIWIINDCKLNDPNTFTLTKSIIELNLNAIGLTFPHL